MERADWIEHRRHDGELVGWMRPDGDDFVPVDLLGRDVGESTDWLRAEELLETRGLQYLAEPFLLELADGEHLRVRITEVSTRRITVKKDDFGAIGGPRNEYTLAWPAPDELQPLR
jgi:hypothetical protein